ncbi:hypothetical protein Tco_0594101 [Tanacetum coccineum]
MSWFSRCSWCGGPFNCGNCRHCTNVTFRDEPVYDSNPNSYNQTPDFSNLLPHHNYETDSRSDTGVAFQAEFAKLQQNFKRFMAQQSCSYCGGPFNSGNCLSCSIVGAGNYDKKCDLPFCDNSVTFSNPLFNDNDDFTSSDDESLPEEDVPEENFKIYSNPLFEFNEEYIFSDVYPLFNKVLEDIESKDSYVSNLDEQALLVTHLSELNEDECFDP